MLGEACSVSARLGHVSLGLFRSVTLGYVIRG